MIKALSRGSTQPPLLHLHSLPLSVRAQLTCVFCQSAQKESSKKANMKRENKAYSYKEQIIELELQEVKCSTIVCVVCVVSVALVYHVNIISKSR